MKLSTLNSKLNLLSVGTNAKTIKSDKLDDSLTAIMYLAPANLSGYEVCPNRSNGCTASCLFTAGRGNMNTVQQARIRKTKLFFEDNKQFLTLLHSDLSLFLSFCKQESKTAYVRLNGTSDIDWENYLDFSKYPDIIFYDYTKRTDRSLNTLPTNYHITFSKDERTSDSEISSIIHSVNVAVVFDTVPDTWNGYKVIQGDLTDLRPKDEKGVIVGLKAKGKAKKDTSGFVIRLQNI